MPRIEHLLSTPPSPAAGGPRTATPLPADSSLCGPDGGELIVRLYEAAGGGRTAELPVGMPVREVHLVDLMERRTRELPARDGRISLEFGPYEIHTIALTPGGTRGG